MPIESISQLDPVIHSKVRLGIMSILVSVKEASFTYLKTAIGTTDGNLSVSLAKLVAMAYIKVKKSHQGKKPLTTCIVTAKGRNAFARYVKALDSILHLDRLENQKPSDRRSK
ncbi:MAG: transcriptional regulator [Candidatus Aminicenantes bacterium]|nr:transcriptional regulator [Candidatus Aminicenantes bacterium]